ncbi:MAG: hypothetical protein ACE5D2_05130 [Fidelibacterota bacterium]
MPTLSLPEFETKFDHQLKLIRRTVWLGLRLKELDALYRILEQSIHPEQQVSYRSELDAVLADMISRAPAMAFETLDPRFLNTILTRLASTTFPKQRQKVFFILIESLLRLRAYDQLFDLLVKQGLLTNNREQSASLFPEKTEVDERLFRTQVLPQVDDEMRPHIETALNKDIITTSRESIYSLFVVTQGEHSIGLLGRVKLSNLVLSRKSISDQVRIVSHLVDEGDPLSNQTRRVCTFIKREFAIPNDTSLRLEYSIDQRATTLVGNSIGLVLTMLAGMGLHMHGHNRSFKYMIYDDVAVTGALNETGKVLPVDKELLRPKLEAAFFSPVKNVVLPAEQLIDAQQMLIKLKDRYPNGSLNLIPVKSYDELLAKREVIYLQRRQVGERARQFVRDHANTVTFSIMAFVLLLMVGFWFGIVKNGIPVSATIEDGRYVIKNKFGFKLWKTEDGVSTKKIVIEDIDGDEKQEILVGYTCNFKNVPSSLVGSLVCYDSDGNIKWQVNSGRTITYGDNVYPNLFSVNLIKVVDCNFDGIKEIICVSSHNFFPNRFITVSTEGEVLSEYWNSGAIMNIEVADVLPDNGVKEILFSGVNNEYRQGILGVLDPFKMGGASPQSQGYYTNRDVPPGNAIYYLKFPQTHFARFLGKNRRDITRELIIKDNNIKLLLSGPSTKENLLIDVFYYLNTKMEVLFVDLADGYYRLFNQEFPDRKPLAYNDPKTFAYFRSIQYWDGTAWSDSVTINRRYLLQQ